MTLPITSGASLAYNIIDIRGDLSEETEDAAADLAGDEDADVGLAGRSALVTLGGDSASDIQDAASASTFSLPTDTIELVLWLAVAAVLAYAFGQLFNINLGGS